MRLHSSVLVTLAAATLSTTTAWALSQRQANRAVDAARSLVGTTYNLGGRLGGGRYRLDGIDCQGVLFFAAQTLTRCGWKSFSVLPTQSVARGELGRPLFGGPVATRDLSIQALQRADVLLLVSTVANPAEPPIGTVDGVNVWVWHTGLYAGDGRWIVGDHHAGRVIEVPLRDYLDEYAGEYVGVLVARMKKGPQPATCRHHPPMRLP